jgi:hypothetical protein
VVQPSIIVIQASGDRPDLGLFATSRSSGADDTDRAFSTLRADNPQSILPGRQPAAVKAGKKRPRSQPGGLESGTCPVLPRSPL